jgi:hypothetical protein
MSWNKVCPSFCSDAAKETSEMYKLTFAIYEEKFQLIT